MAHLGIDVQGRACAANAARRFLAGTVDHDGNPASRAVTRREPKARSWTVSLAACVGVLAMSWPSVAVLADTAALSVIDYHFVGQTRAGRTDYDYTYQITVRNSATAVENVVATATSAASKTTIMQGVVAIGDLSAASAKRSAGTFTFRQDRRYLFDPASIRWTFAADPAGSANVPPVADAGPDQNVFTGSIVRLDGGSSSDADGDELSYAWNFRDLPLGSVAELSDPTQTRPTFQADQPGRYELDLTVFDGTDSSEPDSVIINTEDLNTDPVADAGPDQTNAFVGLEVVLDGSASSDIDGDLLSYSWALQVRPPGSSASLSGATSVNARFTPDVRGEFILKLAVTDGRGGSDDDFVAISTEFSDRPPVADAGPDQSVLPRQQVVLDGSRSSDPDNDAIDGFSWSFVSRPAGSAATLQSAATAFASFTADRSGDYVLQLVVTANGVASAPDTVTITTENARPVANAGPDRTVDVDSVVNLDGNASTDADNDPLSFDWSLVAQPSGSAAVLEFDMTPTPRFTADRSGEFVVQLVVNDGRSASDPDTAVISVVSQNRPPVAVVAADAVSVATGTRVQLDGSASSDPDGDPLTYEWSIQVPAGSSAALGSTDTVDSSFVADQPGSYTITLIVRDEALESGSSTITVVASAPNRAPIAAASSTPSNLTPPGIVTLDGSGSTDADGDALLYQWSLLVPVGSTAALNSTTSVAPSFSADVVGDYVATLVVRDAELASAPVSVTISATRDNSPPTFVTAGDRVAFVGETLAFRMFATDPDAGDVLTFALLSGPTGLGLDAASGDLTFAPSAGQVGTTSVTARVTDSGGLFDDETFAIEVRQVVAPPPVNTPPRLEPIADRQLIVGQVLSVQAVATDPDAGDTLSYSLPAAAAGMTISTAGVIGWTPLAEQLGSFDVTVQVRDSQGAAALQDFVITVRPVNRAPVAVDNLYDARVGETTSSGAPGVLDNDADPDGDALTATLVSDVTNGVLDFRSDGSFDYTPGLPEQTGPVELEAQCRTTFTSLSTNQQTNGTILVGDVDGDGVLEIVGRNDQRPDDGIFVLNAEDCSVEIAATPGLAALGGFAIGFSPHLGLLDIDGDGDLEIIGLRGRNADGTADTRAHLLAINRDGSPAWGTTGASQDSALVTFNLAANTGPFFADLDADGQPEIIQQWVINSPPNGAVRSGISVYSAANGSIRWEYLGPREGSSGDNQTPVTVVDLDLDGTMEIILHNSVISHLGVLEFILPTERTTPAVDFSTHLYSAVANFDDDEFPEIIARDTRNHYLYDHLGNVVWQIPRAAPTARSELTVADFDGDQQVEYAFVAGTGDVTYVQVFDTDGSPLWSHAATPEFQDRLGNFSHATITAFDANRDGAVDVLVRFRDQNQGSEREGLYVFDGTDGSLLTRYRIPVYDSTRRPVTVVDVDDDGEAEILLSWTSGLEGSLVVLEGTPANPLPPAPALFNQQKFSQSYFDHDGRVIAEPTPPWLQPGRNGYNLVTDPGNVYTQVQCEAPALYVTNSTIAAGDVDNDGEIELVGVGFWRSSLFAEPWVLNAADCTPEAMPSTALQTAGGFAQATHPGLLDIDGDGDLEIIGVQNDYRDASGTFIDQNQHLIAVHHDGTLAWPGVGASESLNVPVDWNQRGPTFADIDANGSVEIIMSWTTGNPAPGNGITVFNSVDGSILWQYQGPVRANDSDNKPPTVVDLDLDGTMEIIFGSEVISHLGLREFALPVLPNGGGAFTHLYVAVANFDDDPYPEILGIDTEYHYLFEHDGTLIFRNAVPNDSQSQITVADFDGDDAVEYAWYNGRGGSQTIGYFEVYDTDGSLLWSHQGLPRYGEELTRFKGVNGTAFDANNDGAYDLVVALDSYSPERPSDFDGVYVFDGRDGSVLEFMPIRSNSAEQRFTTIADIDGDGAAEIISSQTSGAGRTAVWEGTRSHPLPRAPAVRNQWVFQEALVDAGGAVVTNPVPHWLQPGLNGWNLLRRPPNPLTGTTDSFTYRASDGVLGSNAATVTFDVQPAGQPPVFLSRPDALTTVGFPYAYAPRVVDADPGDSISFTLVAAPAGMTMSSTGRLDWLPQAAGSFQVSIIASDTIGFATPQSFTLVVGQPVIVPNVIGQPQAAAEGALAGANLLTGAVRTGTHPSVAAGAVFDQAPPAGGVTEFGGRVDLFVSTGPAPEDVDDDGDGFSESAGDCDDSNAGVAPGAPDAPGDGVDSDCDGIDGDLALASILVTADRSTVLTNQTVALTATGIFADGTSQNLTGVVAWTNGPAFSSASAGTFTVSAARGGISGSATIQVRARVAGDVAPPQAVIATPAANSVVTAPAQVLGTATDSNFLRYELAYAPAGETSFTLLATGLSPVTGGVLGAFDPTLLINDLYTLRLTVFDLGGNQTVSESTVQVDGNMKVGNFTLTFTDLQIPMAGIPITVTRTYDSRDKGRGDFGIGWRLDVQTLRIRNSRDLGTGWRVERNGLAFALSPEGTHSVSLTLADGKVETFDLVVSPSVSPLVPFPPTALTARFVPRPGTLGALQSLDNNTLTIFSAQPGTVELSDDMTGRSYNPALYRYTSAEGVQIVVSTVDGVRSLRDRNGNVLSFTRDGITHSAGKSVAFERDELGRIISITDPNGGRQEYGYDGNDDLRVHVDPAGARTRFGYDQRHYLVEAIDPLGNRAVRNEYSADGRLVASIDALGNRVEFSLDLAARQQTFTDGRGNTEVASFDSFGNVVLQERIVTRDGVPTVARTSMSYDLQGNQTSIVDPDGVRRDLAYDSRNNLTMLIADPLGRRLVSTYVYDSQNRLVTSTEPGGLQTSYEYDARGNLIATRNQLGETATFHYDQSGRQIASVAANGSRNEIQHNGFGQPSRSLEFDASGRLLSRTDFEYDGNGNNTRVVTYEDPATAGGPQATTRVFDSNNRVTQVVDARGNSFRSEYDASGRLVAEIDPFGNRTEYAYNGKGDVVSTRSADDSQTSSVYDASGNRTQEIDQLGRVTSHAYDEAGRTVATTSPAGTTSRNVYTPAGRLQATVDESGNRTEYEYDAAGRRTIVRLPEVEVGLSGTLGRPTVVTAYADNGKVSSTTDPNGNTTAYDYDAVGRPIRTVFADGSSIESVRDAQGNVIRTFDQLGLATDYEFDGADRLTRVIQPAAAPGSPERVSTANSYDSFGRISAQTDGLGRVTRFEYNALGRVTERVLPGGQREVSVYDRGLRLSQRADFNGVSTLIGYDVLNRETSRQYSDGSALAVQYTASGQLASVTDSTGEVRYAYDARDNVVAVTQPDGTEISYLYTAAGQIAEVLVGGTTVARYSYDALGRMSRVAAADGATDYGYDLAGNQTVVRAANGSRTERQFDAMNRVSRIRHFASDGGLLQDLGYSYDSRGMKLRATELDGSEESYQYDQLNRLVSRSRTGSGAVSESFQYDRVGNRTQSTDAGGSTRFVYDANDRLLGAGDASFRYDAGGNRLGSSVAGRSSEYTWNDRGQLESVTLDGAQTRFTYDAFGNRTSKRTGSSVVRYVVDDNSPTGLPQVLQSLDSGGQVVSTVIHGTDLLSEQAASGARYHHQDALGSTSVSTDSTGQVENVYRFSSYGEPETVESAGLKFGFTGEAYDAETGLQYLRARYYDPATGVFLSEDPLLGELSDPATRHRYLYAASNPANFTDPTGESYGIPSLGELQITQAIRGIVQRPTLSGGVCLVAGAAKNSATLKALAGLGAELAYLKLYGTNSKDAKVTLLDIDDPTSRVGINKLKVELSGKGILEVEAEGAGGPAVKFTVNLQTGKLAGSAPVFDVPLIKFNTCGFGLDTQLSLLGDDAGRTDKLSALDTAGGLQNASKRPVGFRISYKLSFVAAESKDRTLFEVPPGGIVKLLNDIDRTKGQFLLSRYTTF